MEDVPVSGALEQSVTATVDSHPEVAPEGPILDATDAELEQAEPEGEPKPRKRGWWSLGR